MSRLSLLSGVIPLDYKNLSDSELLENDPSDKGKIAELVARYMKSVIAAAHRYSGAADYDELVSDGMEGLMTAIQSYDPDKGAFSAYSAVCINNKLRNTVKKNIRRTDRLSYNSLEELDEMPDPSPTPEEAVIAKENSAALLRTVHTELTDLERSCIEGIAMGLTYSEIAERLKVDVKSVDNAVSRARAKLRKFRGRL